MDDQDTHGPVEAPGIPCPKCAHLSFSDREAYQHWLEHRQYRGPVIEKGMLITVIKPDGQAFTDIVTDIVRDPKTGEKKVMVSDDLARTMKLIRRWSYTANLLLRPRWIPLWAWKVWLRIRR